MLFNIVIGGIVILATTLIHASGMMLVIKNLDRPGGPLKRLLNRSPALHVGEAVLWLFVISLIEVALWASVYLLLGAIESVEEALYFSMVTFTTLGYGDVLLDEEWRLLASFEAANGIIIFGWSTAIIIAIVTREFFENESA